MKFDFLPIQFIINNTCLAAQLMMAYECRKVYLVGRRGPVQAACTAKELRELLGNSVHSEVCLTLIAQFSYMQRP